MLMVLNEPVCMPHKQVNQLINHLAANRPSGNALDDTIYAQSYPYWIWHMCINKLSLVLSGWWNVRRAVNILYWLLTVKEGLLQDPMAVQHFLHLPLIVFCKINKWIFKYVYIYEYSFANNAINKQKCHFGVTHIDGIIGDSPVFILDIRRGPDNERLCKV